MELLCCLVENSWQEGLSSPPTRQWDEKGPFFRRSRKAFKMRTLRASVSSVAFSSLEILAKILSILAKILRHLYAFAYRKGCSRSAIGPLSRIREGFFVIREGFSRFVSAIFRHFLLYLTRAGFWLLCICLVNDFPREQSNFPLSLLSLAKKNEDEAQHDRRTNLGRVGQSPSRRGRQKPKP
jgi:hypothetical protein